MKTKLSIFTVIITCLLFVLTISCKKDPPKVIPTLSTTAATNTTSTTATSGGTITSDGNSPVTSRGVCWSTNQSPTISDSKTGDGTGIGTFVSSITELSPGVTYYARAYATNAVGTAYGTQITMITITVLPVLTTTDLLGISSTTATGGGNITSDGGAAVIARGVCWSRNTMPTVRADSTTTNGMGSGIFTSSITGLSPGTAYYIRAYATNSVGPGYGNQITFNTSAIVPTVTTTAITDITPETAISGGNVTSDGGSAVIARGICWSTGQTPTITDSKTTDGTGTSTFTSSLIGLAQNTTYYVRAYATNSVGTGYGTVVTFTTTIPSTDSDFKPTGMIPSTISEIESLPSIETSLPLGALMVKSSGTLPSSFEIGVPTPINQQYYNNCVANAVGYGMMSVLFKNIEGHDDYNGDDRKFSPFYIWNQLNMGGTNLAFFCTVVAALKLTIEQGCCKLTDMPLTTPPSTKPSSTAKSNAANYKLSVYKFDDFNINTFKYYLVNGYPLVIAIQVDHAFMSNSYKQFEKVSKDRYVWKKYYDSSYKGHSMLICGYDDNINAFKVMNSWGDNWANNGFFWIDYNFFEITLNVYDLLRLNKDEVFIGIVERPTVSTNSVSEVTNTTVKCGGAILNDFGHNISEKGLCWSTNPDPSTSNNAICYYETGKGDFICSITGLSPGTTYYVKAYAINSEGTAYGKEKQFTTTSSQSPSVTTTTVTTYNSTSATVGGTVTGDGGVTVTDRGVYWGTNPLVLGTKLQIGSNTGVFSASLTGLTPNTTYYIKAYAINSQGTGYGSQVNFTTGVIPAAAFTATPTTITAGQSVQFTDQSTNATSWSWNFGDGGTSTTRNPSHTYATAGTYAVALTATNSFGSNTQTKTNYITVNIAGSSPVAAFTATPTTVTAGQSVQFTDQSTNTPTSWNWNFGDGGTSTTRNPSHTYATAGTYTVALTATNSFGSNTQTKTNYITVTTNSGPPVITTTAISAITPTTAISGGSFTSDGGSAVTSRGVCWSTSQDPSTANSKTSNGTGTSSFTSNLIGLVANTTYYVKVYAINSKGTAYGLQLNFKTPQTTTKPTVTTSAVTTYNSSSAIVGGNVTDDGGATVSQNGVYWGTSQNPESTGSKLQIGSGVGLFSKNITGLNQNTTYYINAYATNSQGTSYGSQISFKTSGSGTINITPSNSCSTATATVMNVNTTYSVSINIANYSLGIPIGGESYGGNNVRGFWLAFKVPGNWDANHDVKIFNVSTNFDPVFGIRANCNGSYLAQGSSYPFKDFINARGKGGSETSDTNLPGTNGYYDDTYYIRIYHFYGNETPTISFDIRVE